METTNKQLTHILDKMYSTRSKIRAIYTNSTSGNIYGLESSIHSAIDNLIHNKADLQIFIKEFSIKITYKPDIKISNRTLQTIYYRIDSILRDFIRYNTSDNEILEYINIEANSIVDYFSVGESIEFLL